MENCCNYPKMAVPLSNGNGMANSVDPDQTAPLHCLPGRFCLGPLRCRPSRQAQKGSKLTDRFEPGNYNYETGSMTGILEHLKWESLKKRRRDSRVRLILLYKGLKVKASKEMTLPP